MRRSHLRSMLASAVLLCSVPAGSATGLVRVLVVDEGGLPIPGTLVCLDGPASDANCHPSDSDGKTTLRTASAGATELVASKPGFATHRQTLRVAGATRVVVSLQLAGSTPSTSRPPSTTPSPIPADAPRAQASRPSPALPPSPTPGVEPAPELPDGILERLHTAGWTPTADRSATWAPGDVIGRAGGAPVAFGTDCFPGEARDGPYTSLDVVEALQAGGRVPVFGRTRVEAEGSVYRQVRYSEPYVVERARMSLQPTDACRAFLDDPRRSGVARGDLLVIQSVLRAVVQEKVCREIKGGVSAGRLEVSGSATESCNRDTVGQVAVAFKMVPWSELR